MTDSPAFFTGPESANVWEKIFASGAVPLIEAEQELAMQELAQAVRAVEQMRASPEHSRVRAMIAQRMEP